MFTVIQLPLEPSKSPFCFGAEIIFYPDIKGICNIWSQNLRIAQLSLAIFTNVFFRSRRSAFFKTFMENPTVTKDGIAAKTRLNVVTTGTSVVVLVLNPAGGWSSYSCPKK